jgi:hypothetical protein
LLKLYYCTAVATDHDWTEILIAESEEEAKETFSNMIEESNSWYAGEHIHELKFEDYEIEIKKK